MAKCIKITRSAKKYLKLNQYSKNVYGCVTTLSKSTQFERVKILEKYYFKMFIVFI